VVFSQLPAPPVHLLEHARWQQRDDRARVATELAPGAFFLWYRPHRLELHRVGDRGGVWVPAEEVQRRSRVPNELTRACGLDRGADLRLWDLMAGLGVDALQLALRGAQVLAVERQPLVAALLRDLCHRCGAVDVDLATGDARRWLRQDTGPDVLYLDPMFPARNKRALPGKRLQYLAALAEDDAVPLDELLDSGRQLAGRVVLKRRRTDPQLGAPDWQIVGRTVRYDVYRGTS